MPRLTFDQIKSHTTPEGRVLCLRTCTADLKGYDGFQWPKEGEVSAPDWSPEPCCGKGLHGLLWGQGDHSLLSLDPDAVFMIVSVDPADLVDVGGENHKVKFPRCRVEFVGSDKDAISFLRERAPKSLVEAGTLAPSVTAGDRGHATAGYRGHATAGYRGHATAGDRGHATAGDLGHATAGELGHATAGDLGHATAGYLGHATAGYLGHATAGDLGHATAGYRGHATAGYRGHATAGDLGHATNTGKGVAMGLGASSIVSGALGACLLATWWDEKADRPRVAVGYVGEDGIEPNTWYHVVNGKLTKLPVERFADYGLTLPASAAASDATGGEPNRK